jgi:predicted ATPase/DNA-binding SARP family transcriptional activator
MSKLKFLLLGKPRIEQEGAPLKLPRKKALALLSYLAMTNRSHSRETLAGLLWPEYEEEKAHASLRNIVWSIKQTLGEEWIVTERDSLCLLKDAELWLDVARFKQLVETPTSHHPQDTPDFCADCFSSLQEAIELYHGDFMSGFHLPDSSKYDEWQSFESERLRHEFEAALRQAVQYLSLRGQFEPAIQFAKRRVAQNPLNEQAHQDLIQVHAGAGQRALAIRQYQECVRILRDELDITPSKETTALFEKIRFEEPLPPQTQGRLASVPPTIPASDDLSTLPAPLLELPFVGRSEEFRQLVSLHQESSNGIPQVVCISGEAGVGKTRLIHAFLNWIALNGVDPKGNPADVISGGAFEIGGRLPYQAVVDALRVRIDRENAPDDLLPDVWLAELGQLLPELRERYPDLPLPMAGEPNFMRSRLFEAVALLGIALAKRRPVVISLDDIQWADEGTLDLLHYLCRRWEKEKAPILILCVAREEALLPESGLQVWLGKLGRDIPLHHLKLSPLKPSDVEQLAKSVLVGLGEYEEHVLDKFSEWLLKETDGLPFFIAELFKMLQEQGTPLAAESGTGRGIDAAEILKKIEAGEQFPVPSSVYDLVQTRLAHLNGSARALLVAGAVMGRETSFARLCQVAKLSEADGLSALEDLLKRRLMKKLESHSSYAFTHDKIREVVYREAGDARRQLYHERALSALEGDRVPFAELAFHALAAGQDEPAFRYSLAAGDEAMKANASVNALSHYNQALDIAHRIEVEPAGLQHLCTARGRALELENRYNEAAEHYQQMIEIAKQRDDLSLELASLVAQTILHATQTPLHNPVFAAELAERSLALARELNDEGTEAKILWGLLLVEAWSNGDNRKALEYGERSLEIARRLGLKEQMGYTLTNLVNVNWNLDETEAARNANLQARQVWREIGNMPMLADSYTMTQICHIISGEYESALQASQEGYRVSHSFGNTWNEIVAIANRGYVNLQMGNYGEAINHIQQAVQLANKAGLFPWLPYYLINAYINVGVLGKAEQIADELLPIVENIVPVYRPIALSYIAQVKCLNGKVEQAEQVVSRIYQNSNLEALSVFVVHLVYLTDAYLQLALRKPDKALERTESLMKRLHRAAAHGYEPECLWFRGKALLAMGEIQRAQQSLIEARSIATRIGCRRMLWRILAELGNIAEMAGRMKDAHALRSEAREIVAYIAERCGSTEMQTAFFSMAEVRQLVR